MGIFCVPCERNIEGGIDAFENHLRRHEPPYICVEGDCQRRKFAVRKSLYRHLQSHHREECMSSSDSSNRDESLSSSVISKETGDSSFGTETDDSETGTNDLNNDTLGDANDVENVDQSNDGIDDPCQPEWDISLERAAARMILDLRKRGNVTGTAISFMIDELQNFLVSTVDIVKKQIASNLKNQGVTNDVIEQCVSVVSAGEPFKSLKTKEQQINYFERNFGLVKRTPEFLGLRGDNQIDPSGVSIPIQVKKYFQYVPITQTLTAVLNNSTLYKLIHSEKKSTDGKMRSFLDGSLAPNHPLISEYPFTIRITLHVDDFDTVNPLGSKTGIHKITEINFQIQNFPPEVNARLWSVFVLAYVYREDLPDQDGIGALLEPFFLEMEQLETLDGLEINVKGHPYTLRVTLIAMAADDLAAHEVLGLYSPSCRRFCSQCTVSKKDLHDNILATGAPRTKQLHEFHLTELPKRSKEFMKANYGVQGHSALIKKAPFAAFPEAVIKDGMHDVLKGIAPMEIKLALHEFCCVKKYFSVFYFNHRIQSFNYGPGDKNNTPSPNFTEDSVQNKGCYTIHQTAAQTWCLLQVFPFLVGGKVPMNNPHLRLLVLLKRIARTQFSHAVSEPDLQELSEVIEKHHKLFFTLYPPTEEPGTNAEEEEELLDIPEDEDFLAPAVDPEANGADLEAAVPQPANQPTQGQKKKKKIRPIHKHHHISGHCVELMRKYGPSVLYWCMRFEGKHALPKRLGAIINCYKNLPVTFLDVQQMYQCSEFLDLETEGSNIMYISDKGTLKEAKDTSYFEALSIHGINENDVLEEIKTVEIAGFSYERGLYLNLQVENNVPLFGHVRHIFVHNDEVYLITQDFSGSYDERFDAFQIESVPNSSVRALLGTNLSPDKPMTAWSTMISDSLYLSPRRTLAECLLHQD